MQIIGGKFRGKRLEWVSDDTTRPTTARVKENIFNILTSMGMDLCIAKVLVLFAGSGQMGIECYSRGAKEIVFNDTSPSARSIIKKNCESIGFKPEILGSDFLTCIDQLRKGGGSNAMRKFDLVFLDPPFKDINAAPDAAKRLREKGMLTDNAVIVAETEIDDLVFENFDVRLKKYGRACIYFAKQCF